MKTRWMGVLVIFVAALVFGTSLLIAGPQPENSFFNKSLHHRGEGMRYWYEKDDGFEIFGKFSGTLHVLWRNSRPDQR